MKECGDCPLISLLAFQVNEASESRIRNAIIPGFNMTCKSIAEGRITRNRDDVVVPAVELIQRLLPGERGMRVDHLPVDTPRVSIQDIDFHLALTGVLDFPEQ